MKDLRILYMGTPDFAVAPLELLIKAGLNIVGVVTNPDKPAGRGQKIKESAVKIFAKEKDLPILQPLSFRDEKFLRDLSDLKADLQLVVAFKFLPKVVWSMPPLGTVNLHASLLPQYRGAAPINWAIMNGETQTGVTTFLLQKEIDTGHIIHQEKVAIAMNETAGTLHDKLMEVGAKLLLKTVMAIAEDNYSLIPQEIEQSQKTAPKIFRKECKIDWDGELLQIYKHICGLSPYPAAWTTFVDARGKESVIKIYECSFRECTAKEPLRTIVSDGKTTLSIAVKGGYIDIGELQQAGRKRMKIIDFLRGFPLESVCLS